MKARLALAILIITVACVAPVGAADSPGAVSAASAAAMAPSWLDRFNVIRAAAGLSAVVENPALSSDAAKHVNYMLLNPDQTGHFEDPNRPGYTPEGHRSASESNLGRVSVGFTAEQTIDGWMGSLYHRYGMLRPELANTGHAIGCNSQGCAAVLDVIAGLQNGYAEPTSVVYPGNGQQGTTTDLISWQFRPFDPSVTLVQASLKDGGGNDVPFTMLQSQGFFNIVAIKATGALAPGTTYTVQMNATQASVPLQRTWSFTTAGGQSGCAGFSDVSAADPACTAITALTSQGIINGYATVPPRFGPNDGVQRAQIAAFLVRALQWQGEATGPKSFTDFGSLVAELKTVSLILANKCDVGGSCVAKGYEPASCVARGKTAPCFGPNDAVSYAQVISFVARAFQFDPAYGWQAQPGEAIPYSGVPTVHEPDARIYHHYAGTIPAAPVGDAWNQPAPRAWVAQVLYQALQSAP